MNGFELMQKLEDLSTEEIEKGTKAWDIAEEIFQIRHSNGEGDAVVTELLSNDFVYDYEDYKKSVYFEEGSDIAAFAEQGLLIKQANDYIFWADEMKTLLSSN